jgi:aldose 1-epimerase
VHRLTAGPARVTVDRAHGGRLASLLVHGHELLVPAEPGRPGGPTDPLLWGWYPMAPFAGRTRGGRFRWKDTIHEMAPNHAGHAMHGTVFDRRWMVERSDRRYLRLRADLEPGWPFRGWAIQEVALAPGKLELRLEVHSAEVAFPATSGWHPWFRRQLGTGRPLEVALDAKRWYPRGDDGLPLGHLERPPAQGPFDDCFTAITWPIRLTWPDALTVEMTSTCGHVVLYDQPRHAICVEPQTGPPDALNHLEQARIVRPHLPLVAEMALTWPISGPSAPGAALSGSVGSAGSVGPPASPLQ